MSSLSHEPVELWELFPARQRTENKKRGLPVWKTRVLLHSVGLRGLHRPCIRWERTGFPKGREGRVYGRGRATTTYAPTALESGLGLRPQSGHATFVILGWLIG